MTDLEMTKLAAEAMGFSSLVAIPTVESTGVRYAAPQYAYCPLHDDAQAMALVKKFRLHPIPDNDREGYWDVFVGKRYSPTVYGSDPDLNRAIVECVAKMQANR